MSQHRLPVTFLFLFCVLVLAGCDRTQPMPANPVAPANAAAPTPPPGTEGYWEANATVVEVTGSQGACQSGVPVGQTITGIGWFIAIAGDSVSLDEDVRNAPTDDLPYSGTLTGEQFVAANTPPASGLNGACPFRGATLSGSFNSDFSTFDATETILSGTAGAEMTVTRHWIGVRE